MSGFRSKFILLLIVYFAGFATAIYMLAPVPDGESAVLTEHGPVDSVFKSDHFAQEFNVQLHRCVDFIKEKSSEAGEYIKEKIEQYRQNNS